MLQLLIISCSSMICYFSDESLQSFMANKEGYCSTVHDAVFPLADVVN